jgi:hypothetical protein
MEGEGVKVRDEIRGGGEHAFALRFHLTPDARATAEGTRARVWYGDGAALELECTGAAGTAAIGEGWRSETWNRKERVPVVEVKWGGRAPCVVETRIRMLR